VTTTRILLPRTLAAGPQVEISAEQPALEFFFLKTAPQLASFFSHGFFQGSVLQRSFTEPAVRQAMGAIGFLHKRVAKGRLLERDDQSHSKSDIHIQLYNRSIRSVIKASHEPDTLPVIIMVSLLFACFELLNRNPSSATAHIKSGIGLLQSWRDKANQQMTLGRGKELTPESRFLEEEIAPLLSILDLNLLGDDKPNRTQFMLNPIVKGRLRLATRFESLDEAKVVLIDIIAAAMGHPKSESVDEEREDETNTQNFLLPSTGLDAMWMWSKAVDYLTLRHGNSWDKRERRSANSLYLTQYNLHLSVVVFQVQGECDWDKHRNDYEELIRVCRAILSDSEELMNYFTRMINLDSGLMYALHFGAWKCRWPKLRQESLDLLMRIPKRDWDFEARHFYQIFTRIKEKEEEFKPLPMNYNSEEICPPEHVRIHDFAVNQPKSLAGSNVYEVSFWTKPEGPQGEWHISTEQISLKTPRAANTVIPSNLLPRKV
jgi:hypothetical protein